MARSSTRAGLRGPLLVAVTLALCGAAAFAGDAERATGDPLSDALVPSPELEPAEVIRIQLEALRHNDEGDRGIEVAFRFASPANRENTGPLSRFIRMIKHGPYALMLDFRTARYGEVEVKGARARQRVTLTGRHARISYWFHVSRQSDPPWLDCWMTDAVYVERVEGRTARAPDGAPFGSSSS